MNNLTRLAIWRPLLMLMVILGVVILGFRAYFLLPVENMPQVDIAVNSIMVVYPGASPEDIENLIIKPIEDATSGIAGLDKVRSVAREGLAVMILTFREGIDGDQATSDVERQLAAIRAQLPAEAEDPTLIKADIGAMPIIELTLSGPQSEADLFDLAENELKPRLQAIPGVGSVSLSGGRERTVLVELDGAKMSTYGVSVPQVTSALVQENLTVPAGSLPEGQQKTPLRAIGKLTRAADVANLVVAGKPTGLDLGALVGAPAPAGNRLVYLRDVATVRDDFKEQSQILRLNGQEAVGLSIIKASDANAVEVADQIRRTISQLERTLPPGARLEVILDISTFTRASINAVQEDLLLAVIITGLVLLLFLHMWRSTIIVLLAIPTSLISTLLVMWILGFSLDTLTLLALTLSVGILVDDSIVVLENIVRHLNQGESPFQAALKGRAEIGLAALAITLADVVIYVPVAFTSGLVGQMFRAYGLTIATAVSFSLLVSFTLTPMLASRWLRREEEPTGWWGRFTHLWERGFNGLANLYARLLDWSLASHFHRLLVIGLAAVSLVGALSLASSLGTEPTPTTDDNRLEVVVQLPPGAALAATDAVAHQVEQIIVREIPEAITLLTRVGAGDDMAAIFTGGGGGGGAGTANLTVVLQNKNDRQRSVFKIIGELRPHLANIPGARTQIYVSGSGGKADTAQEVQIVGPDPDTLVGLADQVEAIIRSVPGAVDVLNLEGERGSEVRAMLDRSRIDDLGLSVTEVGMALRTAVAGSEVGTIDPPEGDEVDITVRAAEADRRDLSRVLRLPVGFRNGQPVTLDQVTTVERGEAPAQIQRLNRQRYLTVRANVQDRSAGRVADDISAGLAARLNLPPGYRAQLGGVQEVQEESFRDMYAALALSVVLLYMLLVALYESFMHPLAIMFSQPVAMVGAFGAMLLTGATVNLISLLGMILLIGIVTKNAILLIDFTNILRRERGLPRRKALVEAGRLRLRPILMTTFAIVLAQLPIALRTSSGAEIRSPMAIVIIGGSLSSLLLTLILVPTVYTYLDGLGGFFSRLFRRLGPAAGPESQVTPAAPPTVAASSPTPVD